MELQKIHDTLYVSLDGKLILTADGRGAWATRRLIDGQWKLWTCWNPKKDFIDPKAESKAHKKYLQDGIKNGFGVFMVPTKITVK